MIVLSKVDLSVAYPLLSMGYVIVLIASWILFKEPVILIRWVGVFVIMFGRHPDFAQLARFSHGSADTYQ